MGFSHKSHEKRSDKETQSPVLKIFEKMMQREHKDPEKHNLLKEKSEKTKKKSHSSRSKSDQKTYDSSSVDRAKNKSRKKMMEQNIHGKENWIYNQDGTQSIPLQNEKRDSWWLWKDAEKKRNTDTDTCSCVTCPLKKLVNSDYGCVSCLVVLFLISVSIVFTVVFKTMPLTLEAPSDVNIQVKRQLDTAGRSGRTERNTWNADISNRLGSYPGLFGSGFGDSSFQDNNLLDDEGKVSSELANVIDADKINDARSSEKLREFYKKLLQTDAQIQKLKQGFNNNNNVISTELNYLNIPDRYKRSLKSTKIKPFIIRKSPKKKRGGGGSVQCVAHDVGKKFKRLKRDGQFDNPEGFLIEKKKVLIQYKPMDKKRQFPKCSHTPMESKTHEKHLKHPFYQNSQRLDELLDHIMDKNVLEMMNDPVQLEVLFSNKGKCNHKTAEETDTFNSHMLSKNQFREKTTNIPSTPVDNGQTANQNLNFGSKEQVGSELVPFFNQHTQNITLFDKTLEDVGSLRKPLKKKPTQNNEKYLTDHSSKFMAKIHADNIPTSTKALLENSSNKYKFLNIMPSPEIPEINYDYHKNFYDQNFDHGVHSNQIGHYMNIGINKIENFNATDISADHLVDIMLDDTTTEKKYDINLDYNEMLSTSQRGSLQETKYINTDNRRNSNSKHTNMEWYNINHNTRKLLQIDEEDDDELEYEDPEEAEADSEVNRKKRNDNVPDVYNRNWKGPIPLYPDELNAIIKQAAIENIRIPTNNKELSEIDKTSLIGSEVSDTDYIEDSVDNKYDKLVELAQAYSDYGVLSGKKEVTSQNNDKATAGKNGNIRDLSLDKTNLFNHGFFKRLRKGTATPSEGIRFEIKPGKCSKDCELIKTIQKHFKISKNNKCPQKSTNLPYDFNPLVNPSSTPYQLTIGKDMITHKLDTKALDEFVSAPKRSLKSVEYVDIDDSDNYHKETLIRDSNYNKDTKEMIINKCVNESRVQRSNMSLDNNNQIENDRNISSDNTKLGVSEFFAMVSDWFNTLAKWSGETINGISNSSTLRNSSEATISEDNKTKEIVYPIYDSDMIDNIGHRSRALLSFEVKNVSISKIKTEDKVDSKRKEENNVRSTTATTTDLSTPMAYALNTTNPSIVKDAEHKNKTVLKRSIPGDDKLIRWNDIYDEEYGAKVDYIEKPTRDKHSVNSDNFVKKSKNWFEGKFKGIANKFRTTKVDKEHSVFEQSSTETVSSKTISVPKATFKSLNKRRIRNIFSDEDTVDFAALTANMKKVVREAANAVKKTRSLKVREDSKEETVASSLMQQLVRLMSDVVDFQVQQKTCSKLPPDLQKFLEWLMSPSEKASPNLYSTPELAEKPIDDTVGIEMPEDRMDDRTQCLGSIQAVQELMRQFDEMNGEDKSKMTGVKEYLENQLNFLNKKAASLEEYNTYKYYKKRETPHRTHLNFSKLRNKRNKDRRIKKGIHRFIKNFSKKHTSTTLSGFDVPESRKGKKRE